MKKYYEWESSERFRRLDEYPRDVGDFIFNEISLCVQKIKHIWQPFSFQFEENKKKFSDFPYLHPSFHAISEQALIVLKDLIVPYVEILPLNIENSDQVFYALNIVQTYDLDTERLDSIYGSDTITVYAFPDDVLPQAPIFRLQKSTGSRLTKTYISDKFREIVEANKLKGLLFEEEMKYRIGPKPPSESADIVVQPPPLAVPKVQMPVPVIPHMKNHPRKDIGPPVTEEMLCEFEKHLPRPLPQDYRDFLKLCNGGLLDTDNNDDAICFPIQGVPDFSECNPDTICMIARLSILDMTKEKYDAAESDLLSSFLFFRGLAAFPDFFLPIGNDWGGGLICLSLGESDYGHVYFWDHEYEPQEPDYEHCYHVANSFQEFMNSLKPTN